MVADEPSLIEAVARVEPDVIVVDLSLPVEGGNILPRLRGRYPAVRVVVLSVSDEPALASQFLEAGAAAVVLKRSAATDLLPAVREVLRGGTYVSPALRRSPGAIKEAHEPEASARALADASGSCASSLPR